MKTAFFITAYSAAVATALIFTPLATATSAAQSDGGGVQFNTAEVDGLNIAYR